MTVSFVFILVQYKKYDVCDSVLHRGHSGDGRLSASILLIYECRMWHLFILSQAMVLRIALGSVVSE